MTIYIDLLFLINFAADFIILSAACISCKVHILRRISAALLGSVYACLFVTDIPEVIFSFPAKILIFMLMCVICFAPCRIKHLVSKSFTALSVSVFFCGIIFTIQNLLNIPQKKNISDYLLAVGLCTGYFTLRIIISLLTKHTAAKEHYITVTYNKRQTTMHGIYDSGNSLCEPITKMPVIIADIKALSPLFPGIKQPRDLCELAEPKDFKTIPYKTISDSGIVFGFIPEKILLNGKKPIKAIIAAAPNKLESDMLLNPVLI